MMKNKLMQKNRMMQKNKMMRLGSGLLVLTMLTTCIISGTFAKYVTGDEKGDSARVAKWGVTTNISGALFGAHYNGFEEAEGADQIAVDYTGSVDSHAGVETDGEENIVAPGTKSENMTISIAGTPEVSGKIEVTVDEESNFSDIWLQDGKYAVMTDVTETLKTADDIVGLYTYDSASGKYTEVAFNSLEYGNYNKADTTKRYYKYSDEVELNVDTYEWDEENIRFDDYENKYYPIVWTLYNEKEGQGPEDVVDNQNVKLKVSELGDSIREIIGETASFDSHENLGAKVGDTTINWQWPFEAKVGEDVSSVVDGCDTILSKLMAWEKASNYQVVKINTDNTITGVTKGAVENGVTYAYADGTEVACLTVGFNINVTVSQTD